MIYSVYSFIANLFIRITTRPKIMSFHLECVDANIYYVLMQTNYGSSNLHDIVIRRRQQKYDDVKNKLFQFKSR